METKPILVDIEVKKFLDNKKIHPTESYNSVLRRLLKFKIRNKGE